MEISTYIHRFRILLLKKSLTTFALIIGIIASFLFIFSILLESVFYFDPIVKKSFFFLILFCFLSLVVCLLIFLSLAKNDRILKYNTSRLANLIGKKISPQKPDLVLNGLQLEKSISQTESEILAKSYIEKIKKDLKSVNLKIFFENSSLARLKLIILLLWLSCLIIFYFNYNKSSDAFYRLARPTTFFSAPKPFTILSMTGNVHIIGGENPEIFFQTYPIVPDTLNLILEPIQMSTIKRDSVNLKLSSTPIEDGVFYFKLPKLFQDYSYEAIVEAEHFWEAWATVKSSKDTIFVTDRPILDRFQMTITPPKYSRLEIKTQKSNIALVQGLMGSKVEIEIESNRILKHSYIQLNGEQIKMIPEYNKASGDFLLMEEGEFTINIVDQREITNRDPIPYAIKIIPDNKPNIDIIEPEPLSELGDKQVLPIHVEISDDFGFTDLQLAYEIRKPSYLQADPYVEMFTFKDVDSDSIEQVIKTLWDLSAMYLMPEDEVHFHFELTDNDNISGPKKTISNNFIIQVPSLSDLFEDIEESEKSLVSDFDENLKEIKEIKEQFKSLELKVIKSEKLTWEQEQLIKNNLDKSIHELKKLEEMSKKIDAIAEAAEKHKLFSPDLIEKFNTLSELINEVIPEELLKSMNELEKELEKIDINELQESLEDLSQNMGKIQDDLNRYLEIFKRLQAEQRLDEMVKKMQQLSEHQNTLAENLNNFDKSDEKGSKFLQDTERNLEDFKEIQSLAEETSEVLKPFSENSSEKLVELAQSELMDKIQNYIQSTKQSLSSQNFMNAKQPSEQAAQGMESLTEQMINIQMNFKQQEVQKMLEKFQNILQDILYLSSKEETLKDNTSILKRNSSRLREFAQRQQLLQDQLNSITDQLIKLSNETFAITPEIGKGIGKANVGMQGAIANVTNRNLSQANKNQNYAMEGLNEAAIGLFNSMKGMQQSGSSSGFEQFLQRMQQMAGQQQSINQQGIQLGLGQMAAATQQQVMQQMLNNQQGIRKSLNELIREMKYSNQKGLGELSGISKQIDEVIEDLKMKRFSRKTQQRQQSILSRMIDSQKSMTKRGKKDKRKSSAPSENITFEGPGGLPANLGQRENLTFEALKRAMNAGYSRESQDMIKKYFNYLSQVENNPKKVEKD